MRIRNALKTVAGISAVFLATTSNAAMTTIDFNSLTSNNVASISIGAVTFTAEGSGSLYTSNYGPTPNGTTGLLALNGGFVPIRATIAGGTSFVSIDLGDYNADDDSLFLRLYDSNDVLLASASDFIPSTFTGMVTLSASAAGTAYAVFGGVGFGGESNVYSDNFAFGAVPEPTFWALMISGFGLVGAAARRRRVLQTSAA